MHCVELKQTFSSCLASAPPGIHPQHLARKGQSPSRITVTARSSLFVVFKRVNVSVLLCSCGPSRSYRVYMPAQTARGSYPGWRLAPCRRGPGTDWPKRWVASTAIEHRVQTERERLAPTAAELPAHFGHGPRDIVQFTLSVNLKTAFWEFKTSTAVLVPNYSVNSGMVP